MLDFKLCYNFNNFYNVKVLSVKNSKKGFFRKEFLVRLFRKKPKTTHSVCRYTSYIKTNPTGVFGEAFFEKAQRAFLGRLFLKKPNGRFCFLKKPSCCKQDHPYTMGVLRNSN
jgi:hypothetical protein